MEYTGRVLEQVLIKRESKMWTCKNCDTKNEDKDLYCACCGEKKINVSDVRKGLQENNGTAQTSVNSQRSAQSGISQQHNTDKVYTYRQDNTVKSKRSFYPFEVATAFCILVTFILTIVNISDDYEWVESAIFVIPLIMSFTTSNKERNTGDTPSAVVVLFAFIIIFCVAAAFDLPQKIQLYKMTGNIRQKQLIIIDVIGLLTMLPLAIQMFRKSLHFKFEKK